ncbi:MAG TPA: hypothetical protein VF902_10115 [Coriobacteriia bacterium]
MRISTTSLGLMVLVGFVAVAPVRATEEARLVVPEGGLVLDGADVEAAAAPEASRLDQTPAAVAVPAGAAVAEPAPGPVTASLAALDAQPAPAPAPPRRPVAFEYSDGYSTRLKIHKWASFLTLPLFATEVVLGQKLYNGTGTDSTRSAHKAVAVGTGALFGVNTVTGVWNMVEGRKDPNRKTKVKVHGILMLVADAGFAVSGFMAPHTRHDEFESTSGVSPSTHRAVALSSVGVATVAYLIMLFGH